MTKEQIVTFIKASLAKNWVDTNNHYDRPANYKYDGQQLANDLNILLELLKEPE